jgi:hypothetical protein
MGSGRGLLIMIDFPSNPTTGQSFTASNGVTWTWDGAKWVSSGTGSPVYLPLSGGTMTGPIVAPSGYALIDGSMARYRNRIINGDMSVDQRQGGVAIAVSGIGYKYIADRWVYNSDGGAVGNIGQVANTAAGITATGQQYSLRWTSTAAHAVVAATYSQILHNIEGFNFNDANFGTANALPLVLEFWAQSSLTGTFAGALTGTQTAPYRSYTFTYSLPTANTWTKIRVNIPGDTAGGWACAGNASAIQLNVNLGSGSTYLHAPGVWVSGNFISAAGAANVIATNNATFSITGVALMVGAAAANAEPEFKKYADNLLDCQRYYHGGGIYLLGASGSNAVVVGQTKSFIVSMRAGPTLTPIFATQGNCTGALIVADPSTIIIQATSTAVNAQVNLQGSYTADADF